MNEERPIIFQENSGLLGQLVVGKHRYRTKHEHENNNLSMRLLLLCSIWK
jgi:flagellar assembly factor FliW